MNGSPIHVGKNGWRYVFAFGPTQLRLHIYSNMDIIIRFYSHSLGSIIGMTSAAIATFESGLHVCYCWPHIKYERYPTVPNVRPWMTSPECESQLTFQIIWRLWTTFTFTKELLISQFIQLFWCPENSYSSDRIYNLNNHIGNQKLINQFQSPQCCSSWDDLHNSRLWFVDCHNPWEAYLAMQVSQIWCVDGGWFSK